MSELYETIRRLCAEKGITPSRMCLDLGWSKSTMSMLKSGRNKTLTATKISAIAEYLGVTADEILGEPSQGATSEDAPAEKTLEDIKKEITEVRHFDGEPLTEADIRLFNDALDMAWELVQKRKKSRSEKNADSKPST